MPKRAAFRLDQGRVAFDCDGLAGFSKRQLDIHRSAKPDFKNKALAHEGLESRMPAEQFVVAVRQRWEHKDAELIGFRSVDCAGRDVGKFDQCLWNEGMAFVGHRAGYSRLHLGGTGIGAQDQQQSGQDT